MGYKKFRGAKNLDEQYASRAKDMAYIKAFRHGFDERYCHSKVKRFTPEEIAEYEGRLK